jgi:hypothetical protein
LRNHYKLIICLNCCFSLALLVFVCIASAQNNALYINGAYIKLNGGVGATPVYMTINQPAVTGIYRPGTGHIISESQYNYVSWLGANTASSYVFPFGTDADGGAPPLSEQFAYVPVTIALSATTATNLTVSTAGKYTGGVQPNKQISSCSCYFSPVTNMLGSSGANGTNDVIERWWEITSSMAVTATLTFSATGAEVASLPAPIPDTFEPQQWTTKWLQPVGTGASFTSTTGLVQTVSTSAISLNTSATPWVISRADAFLPIELLDFSGICEPELLDFVWSTATETNNNYFNIEYSTDAINFASIVQIKGAGNSSTLKQYQYKDTSQVRDGYYRLKQTDFDGKYSYSAIINVNCSGAGSQTGLMSVFPNPSNGGNVNVMLQGLGSEQQVLLVLVNVLGQVVYSQVTVSDNNGQMLEVIDLSPKIAPGLYTIIGSSNNGIYNHKIIIK